MCSFRAFLVVNKPDVEDVLRAEVTEDDLKNAIEDEYGVKYSMDGKRLLKAPNYLKNNYAIRNGVKVICDSAFMWCKSLLSISIPNSVKSIGNKVLRGCESILSINIPNNITHIGDHAFVNSKKF